MPTPEELLAEEELKQAVEYGTYVCGDTPIDIGGARAFNPGNPVPVSHVDRGVVSADQVVKVPNPPKITRAAVAAAADAKAV